MGVPMVPAKKVGAYELCDSNLFRREEFITNLLDYLFPHRAGGGGGGRQL